MRKQQRPLNNVITFVKDVINNSTELRIGCAGRVYFFETKQGVHKYPLIFCRVITSTPIAQNLLDGGEAWRDEVQVDVFTKSVEASARMAQVAFDAFNGAELPDGILSCRAEEIIPLFTNSDEVFQFSIRIFINHKIEQHQNKKGTK